MGTGVDREARGASDVVPPVVSRRPRLVISDVDGTLVNSEKVLTDAARGAVRDLERAGIRFALTSARPPGGLRSVATELEVTMPMGAFNGGLIVDKNFEELENFAIDDDVASGVVALFEAAGVSAWVFYPDRWLVRDAEGPHVAHESHSTEVTPLVVGSFANLEPGVSKIVGVSDEDSRTTSALVQVAARFRGRVNASRSQPYYVDVTHHAASKGRVVEYLANYLGCERDEIVVIGDMANDVAMFHEAGVSIAMGNATPEVQSEANFVTSRNDDEGFARAMYEFVLN